VGGIVFPSPFSPFFLVFFFFDAPCFVLFPVSLLVFPRADDFYPWPFEFPLLPFQTFSIAIFSRDPVLLSRPSVPLLPQQKSQEIGPKV